MPQFVLGQVGKWGHKLNKQKRCTVFHEMEIDHFFQFLMDPQTQIIDFHIINNENVAAEWEHTDGFVPEDMRTNIFLAAFTTSWARLKLYELLDKLGRRVFYYATDSVVFISQDEN